MGHNHSHENEDKHNHSHSHSELDSLPREELKPSSNEILTTFKVVNMDCADEIKAINEALKLEGVLKVQSNLMSSTVEVLHSKQIDRKELKKRIDSTPVKVVDDLETKNGGSNKNRILLVATSGLFLALALILEWTGYTGLIQVISIAISILSGGSLVFPKAIGSLRRKTLDMNVLMTVAVVGAVSIRQFSEAAAVVFLFSLSELFESLSVQRARKAISELLKIAPKKANVIQKDGSAIAKDVSQVQISETIRVRAGESISVDGVIISGRSSVDQASLTGESIPVSKTIGEPVYAGTINQDGTLDIRVTKVQGDTKIAQVIRLVEEAQSQRAVSQKFVDKFAEIYTPAVMGLSVLTFLIPPLVFSGSWYDWLYKALVLLVIACPCALVISTPVSIVSSLTALARKGVLVKGGATLEVLGDIKAIAMDKTGTLTEGKPKVQRIIPFNKYSDIQVMEVAASLEGHSTHPLAKAIIDRAKQSNIQTKVVDQFTNVSGRGVEAFIGQHAYMLGNHRFVHDIGICTPELEKVLHELEEQALSVVVVGHKPHGNCNGEVMGIIALGDSIRKESAQAINDLRNAGVQNIVVLSGDNQKTVTAIGSQLKLDGFLGDLLPEDKSIEIEKIRAKYQSVAMIGDGINDAVAMAKSSVGIAMGFVGSDTAIEVADVTLMNDDLKRVVTGIVAGRRTLGVVKFNITFALATKALFLVLTLMGYTNLWIAVAADTGAALLVILNSLRLLQIKDSSS